MSIIAADVGGTKTHFIITDRHAARTVLFEAIYPSQDYATFSLLLQTFINASGAVGKKAKILSLALAGDVKAASIKLTNLPWHINKQTLQDEFNLDQVFLMNDFQASAYGIAALQASDKISLHAGSNAATGTRVVLGAGTGLGLAWAQPLASGYTVFSTEAGHIDFAPVSPLQIQLLQYLMATYLHVSYERLLSGAGLETIYQFLTQTNTDGQAEPVNGQAGPVDIPEAEATTFTAARVVQQANDGSAIASQAVDLFTEIYGAYIGNIALIFKPAGGIYITGGIAAKIQPWMQSQTFISAFKAKGRMQNLVETISITLVTNESVGVLGAISAATEFYKENG